MGQSVRQTKYAQFWKLIAYGCQHPEDNHEACSAALDLLLRTLTDKQLDEILAEIGNNGLPDARDTP